MSFLPDPHGPMGDGIALEDDLGVLTYRDLHAQSRAMSHRLAARGVAPGVVVGIAGPLDRDLIIALHGVWNAGGAAAPFHPGWTASEVDRAFSALRPHLTLAGTGVSRDFSRAAGAKAFPVLPMEALSTTSPKSLSGEKLDNPADQDTSVRLLTSGTDGVPGTVDLTAPNLRASSEGARKRLGLLPSDRWLASLSVAHVGGIALISRAALIGSGLVLGGSFDATRTADLMKAGRVTHASLVPTMLRRLMEAWGSDRVPGSLRSLLIGGASTPENLLEEALDRGFPVALTYGLSEASSQVATAPPDLVREKPGTVGPPLLGVEVGIGEAGRVRVRGATVAPGQNGPDGWLDTGDLGRMDEDGHLWVTGRASNRIITGGLTVDPGEVESVLRGHPEVLDAVVVGLPDPEWGERLVAAVVPTAEDPALSERLESHARTHLSPGKRPKAFRILQDLPLNPNGKVDRSRVRALLNEP